MLKIKFMQVVFQRQKCLRPSCMATLTCVKNEKGEFERDHAYFVTSHGHSLGGLRVSDAVWPFDKDSTILTPLSFAVLVAKC